MKRLLTLFFLLARLSSFACSCSTPPLTAASLGSHDYVALVKIKEQLPFDETKYKNLDRFTLIQYEVLIDEIVLFKGVSLQKISVDGAPPQSKTIRTSCDIDVSPGQEWIVIANSRPDGSVSIHMCGNSMRYKHKGGFINWQFGGTKGLLFINEVFPNSQLAGIKDLEKPGLNYPNGQVKRTVSYKNKKKDGTAVYYYPDGTIYGRVHYKKDSLNGQSVWYDKLGQIQSKATYRMGIPVDSMISYYFNTPMFVGIRSREGIMQKFQEYQVDMDTRTSSYLYRETLFKNGIEASTVWYRKNGTVRLIAKFHDQGTTELTYDESGSLIKTIEFDKQGKRY